MSDKEGGTFTIIPLSRNQFVDFTASWLQSDRRGPLLPACTCASRLLN
jgi:hypothetical protein